jgi:hypothetical protein
MDAKASEQARGAAIFAALPSIMNEEDVNYFAKTFGDYSSYRNDETGNMVPLVSKNQDGHFAGRYLEFFQWIIFGLEVNFTPFFSGMIRSFGGGASAEATQKA